MPEVTLSCGRDDVVGVFAPASTLDGLTVPPGGRTLRVASDELAIICPPGDAGVVLEAVGASAVAAGGFALDLSGGWTSFILRGDIASAFAYISELHLPDEAFVQGDALRVPVRAARPNDTTLDLLVPSPWGPYLEDELLRAIPGLTQEARA